jgi:hypothetical protein
MVDEVWFWPPNIKRDKNYSAPVQIDVLNNPNNLGLKEWNDWINSISNMSRTVYKAGTTTTEINGITAYIIKNGECDPLSCYQVIFKGNNNLFNFQNIDFTNIPQLNYSKQDFQNNQQIFNTIISTFKFT